MMRPIPPVEAAMDAGLPGLRAIAAVAGVPRGTKRRAEEDAEYVEISTPPAVGNGEPEVPRPATMAEGYVKKFYKWWRKG